MDWQQPILNTLEKNTSYSANITPKLKTEDMILIKDQMTGPFDLVYVGDYRVISMKGYKMEIIRISEGK